MDSPTTFFQLPADWAQVLHDEMCRPYFEALHSFVVQEYAAHTCYPTPDHIFSAFHLCPLKRVKVVLIGQDPYHQPGQAQGLSFSVPEGMRLPPSLRNIYKEVEADTGRPQPMDNGNLERWARQGVLLLNATLTVRDSLPTSHAGHGWETFTDAVISRMSQECPHLVFLLWGKDAREKKRLIDGRRHLVLESAHPSPLSAYRGFFGNHQFTRANAFLEENGLVPIEW